MKGCERISCPKWPSSLIVVWLLVLNSGESPSLFQKKQRERNMYHRWVWMVTVKVDVAWFISVFLGGGLLRENTKTNLKHHQLFKIHQTYVQYLQKIWLTCSPKNVDCMAWWWLSWIIAESNLNSGHSNVIRGKYVVKEDFQIQLHSHLRYDHLKSYFH